MSNDTTPERDASGTEAPLEYAGRVVRFSPGRGVGSLRSDTGREIIFDVRSCEIAGVGRGDRARDALGEGMRVGFDVSRTSRGLRVTWMRLLEERAASEGQARPEGEVLAEEAADQNGESSDVE